MMDSQMIYITKLEGCENSTKARYEARHEMYTLPDNFAYTIYSGCSTNLRIVDLTI